MKPLYSPSYVLKTRQIIKSIFLSFAFICLSSISAKACSGGTSDTHVFLKDVPKKLYGANFVGRIRIDKIEQPKETIAIVEESETHPHQVGNKIILVYDETSCGPRIKVGDSGIAIGDSIETYHSKYGTLYLRPYMTRYGWGEFKEMENGDTFFPTEISNP